MDKETYQLTLKTSSFPTGVCDCASDGVTVVVFNGRGGEHPCPGCEHYRHAPRPSRSSLIARRDGSTCRPVSRGGSFADKRDEASIRRYGPRRLTYPVQLISLDDDIIDAMNMILAVHSG